MSLVRNTQKNQKLIYPWQMTGRLVRAWLIAILAVLLPSMLQAQEEEERRGYILGPNDVISISVYGEEDLSFQELRISDSGIITYPLLGEVRAAGRTIIGLEAQLRRQLIEEEYLIDPRITISMVAYRPFYIDGEVGKPGSYPYEPGLTLRKAVSIAGGFTERASRSNITIHSSENEDAPERRTSSLDTPIRPGDVITVDQRFF